MAEPVEADSHETKGLDGGAPWRHLANTMEYIVLRRRCGLSLPLLYQLVS